MAMARKALESNDIAKIRQALEGVYALQFQTAAQRARKAARQPGIARCESCGRPVAVRRRPRLGAPVYCRGVSRCRVRAFRARQRAEAARQEMAPVTVTPGQVPASGPGSPPETPRQLAPDELWAAFRVG